MATKLIELTSAEKKSLIQLARKALHDRIDGRDNIGRDSLSSESLNKKLPCFVTLSSPNGRLRGCIGSMTTENSLRENVYEFAIHAGFEDPRFPPLAPKEVDLLVIKISVIGPMTPVGDLAEVVLGEYGICVSKGNRRGVLLASVATDYGWDHEKFLKETCVKAGLSPDKVSDYTVQKFQDYHFGDGD